MTSRTMTRLWDSAVVCRRSIASVHIWTAVLNPNVKSVAFESLSIVFGTPTTLIPSDGQLVGDPERVLAADRDQTVDPLCREALLHPLDALLLLERVRPRRPEDRPPTVKDACGVVRGEVHHPVVEDASPPVAIADDGMAVLVDPFAYDRSDHGVEPGAIPASGQDPDPCHVGPSPPVDSLQRRHLPAK